MMVTTQQHNEAFSIAALFYTRLRRVTSRVIDVMYLIENKDYARYILNLAEQTNDADLLKYTQRLSQLLLLNEPVEEKKSLITPIVEAVKVVKSESTVAPSEDEIYRAQVSHHYIGALR